MPQLLDSDDDKSCSADAFLPGTSLTGNCLWRQDGDVTTAPADDAECSDEEERRQ
jgi:hypothetical protein